MPLFSSRFSHDLTPNRLLAALAAKKSAGVDILDLTESNPTRAGFTYDEAGILRALANPEAMRYQPTPRGLLLARQAVADYYQSRGPRIDPDSIFLTASTSESYAYLFKLLADPGDEILLPQPGYPLFDLLTELESARPTRYALAYDGREGWRINFDSLRAAMSDKTAAIVVVNPNNPTGSYLKQEELAELNRLCIERDLALIVDEVFWDYACRGADFPVRPALRAGKPATTIATAVGNDGALTFVVSGLSKIAGLPQVKLGWIQVNGPPALAAQAQSRLEFIADTYLSVSASAQHAAADLLAGRAVIQNQIAARAEDNFSYLRAQCAGSGRCRALIREGGWYAVLEIPYAMSDDDAAYQLLERDDVFTHPGYFFDFDQHNVLVVSLLTSRTVFEEGVARMMRRLGT
ncbi:MAG: pyridoxal phosphate-dependent aminotransferase [Chloroflexota bacterium]